MGFPVCNIYEDKTEMSEAKINGGIYYVPLSQNCKKHGLLLTAADRALSSMPVILERFGTKTIRRLLCRLMKLT